MKYSARAALMVDEWSGDDEDALYDLWLAHRLCGPKYDGCYYAHWPMPHCLADGMVCDVDRTGEAVVGENGTIWDGPS